MKGLVRGGAGVGSLEMTKPKSVTAGIRRRGQWDVVRFGGDKWELEVQVIKDTMVDCSVERQEYFFPSYTLPFLRRATLYKHDRFPPRNFTVAPQSSSNTKLR